VSGSGSRVSYTGSACQHASGLPTCHSRLSAFRHVGVAVPSLFLAALPTPLLLLHASYCLGTIGGQAPLKLLEALLVRVDGSLSACPRQH